MLSWLIKIVAACWRPVQRYARMNRDDSDYDDELLWYKDLVQHTSGDLSIAVVQANSTLEDQSQVESGPSGTFVGIYDGHGGPEAARFVCDHLFMHVRQFAREQGGMSEDVLRRAFQTAEEEFLSFATKSLTTRPHLATVGSCCLIGVIWGELLYVANLGDSRAVMGSLNRAGGNITALQLTPEHNVNLEEVRQELRDMHPDDAHIVGLKHGVWRVKGIIQISRSIGDIYLKKPEVSRDILYARFQLSEPLKRPVLTAEPSVRVQILRPQDRFLIFASDGLWEHLSSQEAVELVHNHPRAGIAKRLIRCALQEAARKREMRYSDVKKIGRGIRRHFHDDITVIVVFVDHELLGKHSGIPPVSLRGCVDCVTAPSCLFSVDGTDVGCSDIV